MIPLDLHISASIFQNEDFNIYFQMHMPTGHWHELAPASINKSYANWMVIDPTTESNLLYQ